VTRATYLLALGSNRLSRFGRPEAAIRAALAAVGGVAAISPIIASAPVGPSIRRFANAAALVETSEPPPAFLARLKAIERALGRRGGRRWGARVIDLDVVLWSRGPWRSSGLTVPHPAFRGRSFVLRPAAAIAPGWRDPVTGRSLRQLARRLTRPVPLPRSATGAGAGP
jgi:2-amino-4-hydroxy-6-hydroxymethyldihydropteridine diphosphokinase